MNVSTDLRRCIGSKTFGSEAHDAAIGNVNTASRLQSAAAPGTVLVGEVNERAASGAIAFEPVGEQALVWIEPRPVAVSLPEEQSRCEIR